MDVDFLVLNHTISVFVYIFGLHFWQYRRADLWSRALRHHIPWQRLWRCLCRSVIYHAATRFHLGRRVGGQETFQTPASSQIEIPYGDSNSRGVATST